MIERVAAAMRVAAEVAIMPRFKRLQAGEIEEKSPGEVVTIADQEAERMLSTALLDIVPGAIVVGEEAVASNPALLAGVSGELAWLVDPLDGTANFVEGTPRFSLMVTLLRSGEAVAAWMLSPAANVMHIAERGSGAFIDGTRVSCPPTPSSVADLRGAVLTRFLPAKLRESVDAQSGAFHEILPGMRCAGEEYPAIVRGTQNFALFWRTLPWDHAPGVLFLQEAGGKAARLDGNAYTPSRSGVGLLAAQSDECWAVVKDALFPNYTSWPA